MRGKLRKMRGAAVWFGLRVFVHPNFGYFFASIVSFSFYFWL